jgi:hypothetical protein
MAKGFGASQMDNHMLGNGKIILLRVAANTSLTFSIIIKGSLSGSPNMEKDFKDLQMIKVMKVIISKDCLMEKENIHGQKCITIKVNGIKV